MPKLIEPTPLKIAVRVYPDYYSKAAKSRKARRLPRPDDFLVFDTETRTDTTQALLFGSYRHIRSGQCVEEGLFHGEGIEPTEMLTLMKYVFRYNQDTTTGPPRKLLLLDRDQFVKKLYKIAYKTRGLIIGFNLPFDLSRIACESVSARKPFTGGFSLGLGFYEKDGVKLRNTYLSRLGIKNINGKSAFIGFTSRNNPDEVDLIPEGSLTGKPEKGYVFRGHFQDLGRSLSLFRTRAFLSKAPAIPSTLHRENNQCRVTAKSRRSTFRTTARMFAQRLRWQTSFSKNTTGTPSTFHRQKLSQSHPSAKPISER